MAAGRRAWGWVIAIAVVIGLVVAAWFAGEAIARSVVTGVIRDEVVTRAGLPADQQVDVEVRGAVLPQLIGGSLGAVSISSEDVVFGSFSGDVSIDARDVPVRGGAMGPATGTVVLDEEQLRTLLASIENFPADSVALDEPDVRMETALSVLGASFPIGVALTPSAQGGQIVLAPASLTLGDAEISASALKARFGAVADAVLRSWDVCIADQLPAGVVLAAIAVEGRTVVATFDIDGRIVSDVALQAKGSCA